MPATPMSQARGIRVATAGALPVSASPLIGREEDLASLVDLLKARRTRLVTLTGPGGVGKTRLALAAMAAVRHDLASWFVPLAAVSDPALVLSTITRALGAPESPDQQLPRLRDALGDRPALLVLDNFEHLTAAGAAVADLLAFIPAVRVLVTSREPLRVRGEQELPVGPLPLAGSAVTSATAATASAAISLFVRRAQEARSEFALTDANASIVAEICRRLDGLPLAIELAAARSRILSPAALLARLENRLYLLTHGPRDLPHRLQTMRDAIAWSYDLLTDEEQTLFRRLAVFSGSFALDAAEAACGPQGTGDDTSPVPRSLFPVPTVLDGIGSLVEKSLVRPLAGPGDIATSEPRYAMLETIREFGLDQLASHGETAELRERHARWYLAQGERSISALTGPDRGSWIARLDEDYPNIRAALAWAEERAETDLMMRLIEGTWRFWEPRGYLAEGSAWVERASRLPGPVDPRIRAAALYGGSTVAYRLGDYAPARARAEESLALSRSIGDSAGIATALTGIGNIAYELGDFVTARAAHEEALARRRKVAPDALSVSLTNLAVLAFELADDESARAYHEESLALRRAVGDPNGIAFALNGLGMIAARQGDLALAVQHFDEAIALRRNQDTGALAASLYNLAGAVRDQGDTGRAVSLYQEALSLRWERGERRGAAEAMIGLAEIAVDRGDAELAARLVGTAVAMREQIGSRQTTTDRDREDRTLTAVRRALGTEKADAAMVAGRATPPAQAAMVAMAIAAKAKEPELLPEVEDVVALTPREREVLKLLANGSSDREIAAALSISPATASRHVSNIYLKLDVSTRTAAAMYAFRHGLA